MDFTSSLPSWKIIYSGGLVVLRSGCLQGLLLVWLISWLIRVCAGRVDDVPAGAGKSAVSCMAVVAFRSRRGFSSVAPGPGEAKERGAGGGAGVYAKAGGGCR